MHYNEDYITDEQLELIYTFEALVTGEEGHINDLLMDEEGYYQLRAIVELGNKVDFMLKGGL